MLSEEYGFKFCYTPERDSSSEDLFEELNIEEVANG